MRLTLVLVFTTLGIVAKAKPKSDPLLVEAHVAVKIKSGSTDLARQSYVSNGRSVLAQDLSGKTGGKRSRNSGVKCEEEAKYKQMAAGLVFNYCPKNGSDEVTSGNYVKAIYEQDKKNLKIEFVLALKCDPKPDNCNCKSLLNGMIEKFPTASKITLDFEATPAIKGCRCYLGTAARNGFKRVEIENCNAIITFDLNNYSDKCTALIGRADQCYVGYWYIKK